MPEITDAQTLATTIRGKRELARKVISTPLYGEDQYGELATSHFFETAKAASRTVQTGPEHDGWQYEDGATPDFELAKDAKRPNYNAIHAAIRKAENTARFR